MRQHSLNIVQGLRAFVFPPAGQGRGRLLLALLVTSSVLTGCQPAEEVLSPEEHFERALLAIEQNDNPEVAVHLVALQDAPGFEPHVHLLAGALGTRVGSSNPDALDQAMNELMLAREHDDTRVPALVLIGKKLRDIQQIDSAVTTLNQALMINPSYVPAHKWLAAIYYDLGAMQNAHNHLQKIADLDPYNTPAQFTMGIINQDYRRFDLAEKNYEECLSRLELLTKTPNKLHLPRVDRQEVLVRLAQVRIQLLEYDKALETLDQALESRMVLSLQATCFRSIDRVDEAREHLDRSIQMFVDNPRLSGDEETVYQEARRLKGTLLIEEKQYAQARGIMETLCSEYPFDAKSLYKLIQAYRGLGMEKEATEKMKIYEPLRAKRERFSNLHLEAIAQPKNADTRYELGNLALELGEFQLAFNWFKAALFIDPQHEKTVTAMNKLYGVPSEQTPASSETQPPASTEPAAKEPASTTNKPAADAPQP